MSNGVEYELPFYFRIPVGTIIKDKDGREFRVNAIHEIESVAVDVGSIKNVVMKHFEPIIICPEDGEVDIDSEI